MTPSSTSAAREVDQLVLRLEDALALHPTHPLAIGAQVGLRDALSLALRHLYGSPRWRAYRLKALARFERLVAAAHRAEAA